MIREQVWLRRSRLPGATVGVLALVSCINALSTSAYLPALPAEGADLAASTWTIQSTLTACLVGVVGQHTWGPLSDAVGLRRPMLVGLTCNVVASLPCAVAPGAGLLLLFRALQGGAACAGTCCPDRWSPSTPRARGWRNC